MKSNSRVLRGWRDFGVKATAIILTILLATQMVGTPAFATATMSNKQASEDIATTVNDTGVDEATTDSTVDATATDAETQTDSATDPADEASATQPTDEGTQEPTDQQAGTAGTDPADNGGSAAAPGSEQGQIASINLDIAEGATITIDGEEFASTTKQTDVAANEELKLTAAAPEGMQVSAVKTVIDSIVSDPIAADENGEYTIAAENVTDALTVKIETSAIESETPSEGEEAPAEEGTEAGDEESTDSAAAEGEGDSAKATDEKELSAADKGIALFSAGGGGITGGIGSDENPYEIKADSSAEITEDYKNGDSRWSITEGEEHGSLSNKSIGSGGYWHDWVWHDGEDAHATLTVDADAPDGATIVVRFGYRGWIDHYEYTYFKVINSSYATLSFDGNGAHLSQDAFATQGAQKDSSGNAVFTIPGTTPQRDGNYVFAGWATTKDATVAEYQPNNVITVSQNTTLYAVWKQSAEVRFDLNGGSGTEPDTIDVEAPGTVVLPSSEGFSREGFVFLGWATSSDANVTNGTGAIYDAGQFYQVEETTTFYAIWAETGVSQNVHFFIRMDGVTVPEPSNAGSSEYTDHSNKVYLSDDDQGNDGNGVAAADGMFFTDDEGPVLAVNRFVTDSSGSAVEANLLNPTVNQCRDEGVLI